MIIGIYIQSHPPPMYRIAVYGKGGAGKSTVSGNLSYLLSRKGSVLHVGCDPKHDSTALLTGGRIETFATSPDPLPLYEGPNGMGCIECGGAEPGSGCAGKGLEMLFSRISGIEADYRVSDVLGDVVCGGFSVPARASNCDAVVIVVSGEFMSLYAANNILRGLSNINPGPCVMGLVLNRRGTEDEERNVDAFAESTGLPILCDLPRSPLFARAEAAGRPLCDLFPDSPEARSLERFSELVSGRPALHVPRPLSDEAMCDIVAGRIPGKGCGCRPRRERGCGFETYDCERNVTYSGPAAVPSCTSHGAADAAMRIQDVATVIHGPRNCAYLGEYAFRRRAQSTSAERSGPIPGCATYSTGMDASSAFTAADIVTEAVLRAKRDGFSRAFLVPTCPSEIMGVDLRGEAARASAETGVDVIPAAPDLTFLGSKFGGAFGVYRALAERMPPMDAVPGTVNLVARWFYGVGRDRNLASLGRMMGLLGLRQGRRFLDYTSYDDVMGFREGEFDIQLGRTRFNRRISEMLSEVTGRRGALELDVPVGLSESLAWVRGLSGYTGRGDMLADAERSLAEAFREGIDEVLPETEGRRAVLYCLTTRDVAWQVETLSAMGMEVEAVFADGWVVDHNEAVPELGIPVREGDASTLAGMLAEDPPDIVVTNDPNRVGRLGAPRAPLGARTYGVEGAVGWARTVADCMRLPSAGWEAGL